MEDFSFFMLEGYRHIRDINAYDHILFIVALCAIYSIKQWKTILWLVTAFTLGHSIALALAVLKIVKVPTELTEFLIPVTILATCIQNIWQRNRLSDQDQKASNWGKYGLITFFGLVHGVGFSNYLRYILGEQDSLLVPLLGFNVGLELGQLLIVAIAFAINLVFLEALKLSQQLWIVVVSSIVGILSIQLAIETGKALFGI